MRFVGIDLAWSSKNQTGIAVIEGDAKKAALRFAGTALADDEIMESVEKAVLDNDAFVAVDAPLIVPNNDGRRPAEELVGRLFRKYNAGAHPANRKRLSEWTGTVRGEDIADLLSKHGFEHSPYISRHEKSRKFFEVYPHPSMVVLFNLSTVIPYKNKPNRDYKSRWKAFENYQDCLKQLKTATPQLHLPKELVGKNIRKLKGGALKEYEDTLDAVFCAYIAYYAWCHPEKCEVLGTMKDGYILTPVFDAMKRQLGSISAQRAIADFR